MIKNVILSDLKKTALPLVKSMAEKDLINLILLSDACFLLNDSTLIDFFVYLKQKGVTTYVTNTDVNKRSITSTSYITVIDYEMLVDLLVSEGTTVCNL